MRIKQQEHVIIFRALQQTTDSNGKIPTFKRLYKANWEDERNSCKFKSMFKKIAHG